MSQQTRKAPQELLAFPMITAVQILECLAALGIPAQMEDLTKPTAQTTQSIYASLLEVLMGAPMELLDGPKAALLGMMEYKEMYTDTLQFTMFFRHCRDLAQLCGISDFTLSDLTRPESHRFRTCLSGIMNFAKFRDERAQYLSQLQSNVQKQAEKTIALRRKLEKIEAQIDEITARNAAERPQSEQAQKRNEGLRNELLELRGQQVKLSGEVEELKKERQGLMDQAAHNNHLITQLGLQINSTKSRLVQSPDRIKRHISEMSHALSTEKAKLVSFQHKARELSNRLEVIGSLEVDLKGLIDLEKGIDEQRARVEESKRGKVALEARLEGKKIESQGLEARLEQLGRQLQNASDKLARQQEMKKEFGQRGVKRIEDLKAEYKVRTKERGVWQKQRDVLIAEQKELEAEMAAFITKHENEINELLAEYWTMRRQAEDYMNTMTVKLGLQLKA
ncbi:hypothetical protein IAR55_004417 [Kwoniella newhampshirensis]|uniref:Kinetochore protein Nuf2 n=1 Tax=Kwoniella newhampshirensis TaxID=1651941 RepID=A0AAW0YXN4_9TREE